MCGLINGVKFELWVIWYMVYVHTNENMVYGVCTDDILFSGCSMICSQGVLGYAPLVLAFSVQVMGN